MLKYWHKRGSFWDVVRTEWEAVCTILAIAALLILSFLSLCYSVAESEAATFKDSDYLRLCYLDKGFRMVICPAVIVDTEGQAHLARTDDSCDAQPKCLAILSMEVISGRLSGKNSLPKP